MPHTTLLLLSEAILGLIGVIFRFYWGYIEKLVALNKSRSQNVSKEPLHLRTPVSEAAHSLRGYSGKKWLALTLNPEPWEC